MVSEAIVFENPRPRLMGKVVESHAPRFYRGFAPCISLLVESFCEPSKDTEEEDTLVRD